MANILLLIADIGPAEGSLYGGLKQSGHEVFTYSIAGRWIPKDQSVPLWMNGFKLRNSPMASNWLTRAMRTEKIDTTIASGLRASGYAANNLGGNFYPFIWRGDLDFSGRDKSSRTSLADLFRTTDRLLLEDPWEMDKAVAKNSQVPHFLTRYPLPPRRRYLTSDSGNVAIIYPRSSKQKAEHIRETARDTLGRHITTELVDIQTLYTSKDLAKGHDLYDTLAHRLGKYSYAIVLGTGPHHSSVIQALVHDKDRIVVDQTIGMAYLSDALSLPHRSRGLQCVQELKHVIRSTDDPTMIPSETPRTPVKSDDLLVALRELWRMDLDWEFEELPAIRGQESLNIFFSVGAVQDITQGARHQRVRNMHDEFSKYKALNIYGSQPFLKRRLKMASKILSDGRRAGIFYGENSTSPMPKDHNNQLRCFLETFSSHGGRSMWFVRDLHWLERFQKSPWSEDRTTELISNGLYELCEVGDRADILAAPSRAAGRGFNDLLTAVGEKEREWHPLPPAVQPQNIVDDNELVSTEGITLLYTGGISEIYGMELYLEALQGLENRVMLDFVVRKPEVQPLEDALERHGLLNTSQTRILHTSMDLYKSRTSRTLGMILLDSDYAKFAFPYKTVTMLERGYPILCYSDMGIAEFVASNKVGVAVERSVSGIRGGIDKLSRGNATGIHAARRNETWENRAREVCRLLSDTR